MRVVLGTPIDLCSVIFPFVSGLTEYLFKGTRISIYQQQTDNPFTLYWTQTTMTTRYKIYNHTCNTQHTGQCKYLLERGELL